MGLRRNEINSPGVKSIVSGTRRRTLRMVVAAHAGPTRSAAHPRPTNGILLAITVMNSTLASSGRLAM
jgi:hypothetical protein